MIKHLIPPVIAMAAALAACQAFAQAPDPDMRHFPKWTTVMERSVFAKPSTPFHGELKPLLDRVHARYAKIPYVEDAKNFGVSDLWLTREELLSHGSGDCEDFAIAEYYDLAEAGVPEESMQIMILLAYRTQEIHAVLRVGDWFLDRRAEKVMPLAALQRYYRPIYRINRHGWVRD